MRHLKILSQKVVYDDYITFRVYDVIIKSCDLSLVGNVRASLRSFPNIAFCLFFIVQTVDEEKELTELSYDRSLMIGFSQSKLSSFRVESEYPSLSQGSLIIYCFLPLHTCVRQHLRLLQASRQTQVQIYRAQ